MPRYFLDTNVIVYAFDKQDPVKTEQSWDLLRLGLESREAVVSYQVVQEFVNVAVKRFRPSMSFPTIRGCVTNVLRPLIAVESSPMLTLDALEIHERYRFAWYDSLILAAAKYADCEILYSEDLQTGFQLGKLKIVNPFAKSL